MKKKRRYWFTTRGMSLCLTAVILFQMFGAAVAPIKTYAATHLYNYERYAAVAIPYGPWVNHFDGVTKKSRFEDYIGRGVGKSVGSGGSAWHIKVLMYKNATFDPATGGYSYFGGSTEMQIDTANTNSNDYNIMDYPYVASIWTESRHNQGVWVPVTLDSKALRIAWYASYDQSDKEASFYYYEHAATPAGYNYSAGAHLATIQAVDGTYPANGRAPDGYYYVRTDVVNSAPNISISTSGNRYISGPAGASPTLYVNGTASDADGDTLFISATLGNVTKTATIVPGSWQLDWSYSEFNREGMEMLSIVVSDGYGGFYSAAYSGTIVIDKTPPTPPTLTPDRGGWHNGNKVISIAHGADHISGVQKSQYQIGNGSWQDYAAPFTVSDSVTVNARTLDQAGNVSAVTSLDSLIDKVPPSPPSLTADRSGWYNGNKVITIGHGTDALSGVLKSQYQIGSGSWMDYAAPFTVTDRVAVSARTLDRAGNISSVTTLDTQIDKTEPTPPSLTADRDGWHNGDKIISLSHGQVGPSGVLKSQIQIDSGNWTDYAAPFTVSDRVTINGRTLDQAGNIGPSVTLDTQIDKISPAEPTIEIAGGTDWQSGNKSVKVTDGTDAGGSGVKETEYRINSGNWTVYAGPIIVTDEGQTIEARTWDQAGNVSSVASADIRIDKTPPTAPAIVINPAGDTAGNVEIAITPGVDAVSGVKVTEYKVGASSWEPYAGLITLSSEGEHQIFARSIDNAGNISTITRELAVIDRTPPSTPSITLSTDGFTADDVHFNISGSTDTRSFHYEYKIGNRSYTAADQGDVTEDGATVITARAVDAAGNISEETSKTVRIDKRNPAIQISPTSRGWSADPILATIHYSDEGSGINPARRYYKVTSSPDEPTNWDLANSNSFQVNITQEGTWYIHAKVEDNVGNSTVASSSAMLLQQLPAAPTLSVQSIGLNQATLQWELPAGNVYTDGYKYTLRNITNGQTMNVAYPGDRVVDQSLSPGTNYEYELTVRNHVGEVTGDSVRLLTLPAAPTKLELFPVEREAGELTVSFESVPSADSYRIVAFNMASQQEVYNQTVTDSVYQPVMNLDPGTVYNVAVSAINTTGEGPSIGQSILTLPDSPDGFKSVTIGENQVDLTWHSVTSATYYVLDRDGTPVTESVYEGYTDVGLSSGTKYDYRLSAMNSTGAGAFSHLNVLTLPGVVHNLAVVEARRNELLLAWNQVRGASGYRIVVNGVHEYVVGEYDLQTTISDLPAGTPVEISIQALNPSGFSVTAATYGLTLPDQLGQVEVSGIQEDAAVISWSPVHGATKYVVEVDGRQYTVSDTRLDVSALSGGTKYRFQITAANTSGQGEALEGQFVTLPSQVNGFTAESQQDTSFTLTWEPVKGATKYVVYQGEAELGEVYEPRFNVIDLKPGKNYSFVVVALNDSGKGTPGEFHWRALPSALKEGDVWVNEITTSSASVEWNSIPGADFYRIFLDGDLIGDTTELIYSFSGFNSSERHSVKVEPVNSSGVGKTNEVSFETLPDSNFTVDVESRKTSITITVGNTKPNDTIVIVHQGEVIYKGKGPTFVWEPLKSGTSYEFEVRTENSQGDQGDTKTFTERTKSSTNPIVTTPAPVAIETPSITPVVDKPVEPFLPEEIQPKGKSSAEFQDIEHTFNRDKIKKLASEGIILGTSDTTFEPHREITRAEFASLMVRALNLPDEPNVQLSFIDLEADAWYIPELQTAIEHVVARGFSDKEFAPNRLISREQASKMLANAIQPGEDSFTGYYVDENGIAEWAKTDVLSLTQQSLLQGYPDGSFRPKNNVSRAEAAEMLYNLLQNKGTL